MYSWGNRSRSIFANTSACLAFIWFLVCMLPPTAQSEWYAGGYGGYSAAQPLTNVKMDQLGERLDTSYFQGGLSNPKLGTYTQTLSTSDANLKQSPMYGGKAGYFFNDEGAPWLGVEVEAFTSQPTIRNQTVKTIHDITYIPFSPNGNPPPPAAPPNCTLGVDCQLQRTFTGTTSLPEASMRLYTVAVNVVARYPGTIFQPYVGVGAGAFYFTSSGPISGRQIVPGLNAMVGLKVLATEEWGLFLEGKYNRATLTNFDPNYGLSGEYSAFNFVAGVAYHF
ncbi:MAG: outer membrane beta-barrel protein [Nitrospirota bacterium]|nr:outer membrane beta-barrel protein [Nitrospirota bacterium]